MDASTLIIVLTALLGRVEWGPDAFFEFTDARGDRFVIELIDPRQIEHARAILRGEDVSRRSIMGKIVKRPADYNPGWSYHLNPRTIRFFDFAIEVCDSSISYVQENLDEAGGAFLPGRRWCPWSSQLSREVTIEVRLRRLLGL